MTTDFRALCVELTDCLEKSDWPHRYKVVFQQWVNIAHAALAEPKPEPEGPTDEELRQLYCELFSLQCSPVSLGTAPVRFAHAVLARWGSHLGSPDSSDGPAVSDDREPASVIPQLTQQLHRRATILLIRKVIDQAIHDTASVHWRVADTGEQLVRATDLLAWAEHMEKQMEQLDD